MKKNEWSKREIISLSQAVVEERKNGVGLEENVRNSCLVRLTDKAMGGGLKVGASVHIEAESVRHAGDPHYQPRSLAVGYRHPPLVHHHSTHPHLTNGDRTLHFSPSHPCHTELQINLHLHTPLRASRRGFHSNLAHSNSPGVGRHGSVVGIGRNAGV